MRDSEFSATSLRRCVMLRSRIIPCLDVADGRVVKGVQFVDITDEGDPVELAARYTREGADEICFLDITASHENRGTLLDVVRRTAEHVFVPLTVGGGVRTVDDMRAVLRAGADKVTVNTAAVDRPELISECAAAFGSQCVVVAVDARRRADSWQVVTHGGRNPTGLDAIEWIERCVDEEWSLGDYVLSGGELAAMVMMDAVIRLLPGALGAADSAQQDSYMEGLLDCPHYTRPEMSGGRGVPGVLVSGYHEAIRRWRLQQRLGRQDVLVTGSLRTVARGESRVEEASAEMEAVSGVDHVAGLGLQGSLQQYVLRLSGSEPRRTPFDLPMGSQVSSFDERIRLRLGESGNLDQ